MITLKNTQLVDLYTFIVLNYLFVLKLIVLHEAIIDFTRMERNLNKQCFQYRWWLKQSMVFSHMLEAFNLLCFRCFAADKHIWRNLTISQLLYNYFVMLITFWKKLFNITKCLKILKILLRHSGAKLIQRKIEAHISISTQKICIFFSTLFYYDYIWLERLRVQP